MEEILNQCFTNLSSSVRYSLFNCDQKQNCRILSINEINNLNEIITKLENENSSKILECIECLNTEREILLKQNNCLLSALVSYECTKKLFKINPEAYKSLLDNDINIERETLSKNDINSKGTIIEYHCGASK